MSRGLLLTLALAICGCRGLDKATDSPSQTSPSPPIRVGQIKIEGNDITQDRVILHQLHFKTGDVVDEAKFKKAESNLARLGIFDTEHPPAITVGNSDDSGGQTIVVRVKETKTGQVGFGVGAFSR